MVNPVTPLWPSDFPDDCPPEEAAPANGVYYRIVKADPTQLSDFVSVYHLDRCRAEALITCGAITQCELMGLSVYADLTDAERRAERYPQLGNKIARLSLEPHTGAILSTPRNRDSHHTWWTTDGYSPTDAAVVVVNL